MIPNIISFFSKQYLKGVVHKLRLQEEYYKNFNFYKVETVNEGG